jgi:hypothetical protein
VSSFSPSKSLRAVFITAITFVLFTQFASTQQTLGSINGTVTDASGAVVQAAQVCCLTPGMILASGNTNNFGVIQQTVGSNRFLQLPAHLTF